MDLKNDYEKLYQHWLNEFQQTELTVLNKEIFENYKNIISQMNKHHEESDNNLKYQIFESYKQNINYMFNDLLKIREFKIINSALALIDIEIENMIEPEKLLYQNLISTIKGYKKVKAASVLQKDGDLQLGKTMKATPSDSEIGLESEIKLQEAEPIQPSITEKEPEEQFDYILLKFLKKTPPLVGIDLINYGPFDKEDIALIPSQNANILISEKFAEKIELS